jgi:hypothetical protein
MGKEELPRGWVAKLTYIIALDTHDLAIKLSTNKREEQVDSWKSVKLKMKKEKSGIVQKNQGIVSSRCSLLNRSWQQ